MKVVILAGGFGTRLSEETEMRPKPMVEIGGKPILWHIMKIYSRFGFNDFIICLGYKGYVIKEYFSQYFLHQSDVTIDLRHNQVKYYNTVVEPWTITLVDTGAQTLTGGRVKRIQPYTGGESFMVTYGDGVADIDLNALVAHHRKMGKVATVTAVQPTGRFGALELDGEGLVRSFVEKPPAGGGWINGGFFVMEPEFFQYLPGDDTSLEREPLETLVAEGKLAAFPHRGFWQPMDTQREKNLLEGLWKEGNAPWKTW